MKMKMKMKNKEKSFAKFAVKCIKRNRSFIFLRNVDTNYVIIVLQYM